MRDVGVATVRRSLPRIVEDAENGLCDPMRTLLGELHDELAVSDERLKHLDVQVKQHAQSDPVARRIQQLEGVGPMVASALVSSIGDGRQFKNGREFAAWLGIVPSTLERTSLGGSASGVTAVCARC